MSLDSVQIIKCLVKNNDDETSYRLIEKDNFDLWRYLVTTKHHITILESTLCLWISREEFTEKQAIYQRAGQMESANRLVLMMYDDHGNFNNTCRYVLDTDTSAVEKILLSHIPEQQRKHHQYSLVTEPGQIVSKGPHNQLSLTEKAVATEISS